MNFATKLSQATKKAELAKTLKEQFENALKNQKLREELRVAIEQGDIIVAGAMRQMEIAAESGAKSYEVIRLKYAEYSGARNNAITVADVTSKKIVHVYEKLLAEGLTLKFDFRHDGVGMESWYVLVASWA